MHIQDIRSKATFEEIDYVFLKDVLKPYSQPRNKIRALLKSNDLIRVKKGLYVFGPTGQRGPYCQEHLANLIYGPSAISLEYALSFYGLIPERVETVTSVTLGRNKIFNTPLGRFTYQHLSPNKYSVCVTQVDIQGRTVLIASPEKALSDKLVFLSETFKNSAMLEEYLFEDLRIDENGLKNLNITKVKEIMMMYRHPNLRLLHQYIMRLSRA